MMNTKPISVGCLSYFSVLVLCSILGVSPVEAGVAEGNGSWQSLDLSPSDLAKEVGNQFDRTNHLILREIDLAHESAQQSLILANRLNEPQHLVVANFSLQVLHELKRGRLNEWCMIQRLFEDVLQPNAKLQNSLLRVLLRVYYYPTIIHALISAHLMTSCLELVFEETDKLEKQNVDQLKKRLIWEIQLRCPVFGGFGDENTPETSRLLELVEDYQAQYPESGENYLLSLCRLHKHLLKSKNVDLVELERLLHISEVQQDSFMRLVLISMKDELAHLNYLANQTDYQVPDDLLAEFSNNQQLNLSSQLYWLHRKHSVDSSFDISAGLERIMESPTFLQQPHRFRQHVMRVMYDVNSQPELISQPDPAAMLQSDLDETKANEKLVQELIKKSRNDRQRLEANQQSAELAYEYRLAWFHEGMSLLQRYSLVATLIILAMFLAILYIVTRRRLSRTRISLDLQQQENALQQDRYNEIAARLLRFQRMESLGLMASGIAHDFNNMLVGVLGNAELIQSVGFKKGEEFLNDRIRAIIVSARKAGDLAKEMLAYAGRHPLNRSVVDLNHVVYETLGLFRTSTGDKTWIEFQPSETELPVLIDNIQIERAILNLLSNALQASPSEAAITVKTGKTNLNDHDHLTIFGRSTHVGEFVWLAVSDQGPGIKEADQKYIFEPFYSKSSAGRGLGLSVVYGVVKSHDGLIECQSQLDVGTEFKLYFPIAKGAISSSPPASQAAVPPSLSDCDGSLLTFGQGKTVLLIDDQVEVAELCQNLLEMAGWEVICAAGGRQGLQSLLKLHGKLDCVLMDIVMPDMSAGEVLNALQIEKITTPVVLMSGFSQVQIETFLERPNVVAVLSKPFQAYDILKSLKYAVSLKAQDDQMLLSPSSNHH